MIPPSFPDGWDTNYGVGIVNYMNILKKMRTETPKISHSNKLATITATVYLKGGKTVTYKFTVEYEWWQQIIRIFLLGFLWY